MGHAAHKIRPGVYNIVNMSVARRLAHQNLTRPGLTITVCRMNPQQESATSQPLICVFVVAPVEKL